MAAQCTQRACAYQSGTPPGHASRKCSWQGQKQSKDPAQLARRAITELQTQQFLIQRDQSGIPSSSLCITLTRNHLYASPLVARREAYQKHKAPRQSQAGGGGCYFWEGLQIQSSLSPSLRSPSDAQEVRIGLRSPHHILRIPYRSLLSHYRSVRITRHRPEGQRGNRGL